jgi:hypothetical protein
MQYKKNEFNTRKMNHFTTFASEVKIAHTYTLGFIIKFSNQKN